jgi:hypothetical protein
MLEEWKIVRFVGYWREKVEVFSGDCDAKTSSIMVILSQN